MNKKLLFLVILIVGTSLFFYNKDTAQEQGVYVSERYVSTIEQDGIEQLLEQVGRHIILPEGEIPKIATVIDAEALSAEQPFYKDVINGDKVMIYTTNQQAIIYSPSRDIIVNVGPVVLKDPSSLREDVLEKDKNKLELEKKVTIPVEQQ